MNNWVFTTDPSLRSGVRLNLARAALVAAATVTVTLIGLWPKPTNAGEVLESERQGEWDDDGMRFGDIVRTPA